MYEIQCPWCDFYTSFKYGKYIPFKGYEMSSYITGLVFGYHCGKNHPANFDMYRRGNAREIAKFRSAQPYMQEKYGIGEEELFEMFEEELAKMDKEFVDF